MKVTYMLKNDYTDDGTHDYIGLEVFINGRYEGSLTGFCSPDAIRKILTGEAEDENK